MNKFLAQKDIIPFSVSLLSGIIGILVLWGWLSGNPNLIDLNLHSTGMQYNTALCFIAASVAILALCKNFNLLACILGAFILSIGYLSFAEDIFGLNIGLDFLFMPESYNAQEPISKRMSANGALILGLIGTSIFVLGYSTKFRLVTRKLLFVLMVLSLIGITTNFMAVFGYIVDLPEASGWGSYTKMAIHTAVGESLLTVGIIAIIFQKASENKFSYVSWVPWLIFIVLEVITLSFWQASKAYVEKNELQQNTIASEGIRSIVKDEIESRKRALGRMASRWQVQKGGTPYTEWIQDALNIISDESGYQAIEWADPNLFIRWVTPLKGNEAALNINLTKEEVRAQVLLKAIKDGKSAVTPLLTLKSGHKGFLIYAPIGRVNNFQGVIIGAINAKLFFDEIFKDALTDYNIAIYHQNELIYERHPSEGKWSTHDSITYVVKEHDWSITSWPLSELAEKQHSWLPNAILVIGSILALMLSLISYLAQIARKNAHMAREEIKVRQKTEQQLIVYSKKLKKQSLIDPLTKVDNRRSLSGALQNELAHLRDSEMPLSIILMDVDHFKHINDTYGHVTGDNVLQRVGSILRKSTRSTDIVARYGGEEFCIVLRNTTDRQAYTVAEKMRILLAEEIFLCEKKDPFHITCSFGVYQVSPKIKKISQVFNVVDGALYTAKNSGRNCVVLV